MSEQIKLMSAEEKAQRRAIAVDLVRDEGVTSPEKLVDLMMSTAMAEIDNDAVTRDPVTGKDFTALQLMEQMEAEGRDRLGRQFSERRGYTVAEILQFEEYVATVEKAISSGANPDELQFANGIADGQLDVPPSLAARYGHGHARTALGATEQVSALLGAVRLPGTTLEIASALERYDGQLQAPNALQKNPALRQQAVLLAEHAYTNTGSVGVTAGIPGDHQRAAMGVARTIAMLDGKEYSNPFSTEVLRRAYHSEHRFLSSLVARPEAGELRAKAFLEARTPEAKQDAAASDSELRKAFAQEAALHAFATARVVPQVEAFMDRGRQVIADRLAKGSPLPEVAIKSASPVSENNQGIDR